MNDVEVVIPIVENDGNDVRRAKLLLEHRQFWKDAMGNAEWLERYRIRVEWVGAAEAERSGRIDKRKALARCLELGAPLVVLDIGLSKEEEDFVRARLEEVDTQEDVDRLWGSPNLEKAGGLWILRELAHLREIGFGIPAIAINTQFRRLVLKNPPAGDVSWSHYLLRKGASFVYGKPMAEDAAVAMLLSVANILSASPARSLSAELAGLYYSVSGSAGQSKDNKLWQRFQALAIARLDAIMEQDRVSGQRGRAERIGIAYNTYRNWLEKGSE